MSRRSLRRRLPTGSTYCRLLRLDVGALGEPSSWPPVAYVLSYTWQYAIKGGNGWPSFALADDGRLVHDIPARVFLDEPVLSDEDREKSASAPSDGRSRTYGGGFERTCSDTGVRI